MSPPRLLWVAATAVALLLSTPGMAAASRIDNDTDEAGRDGHGPSLTVWFDCGVACGNYFDIDPQQSVARHGKGGHVQAGTWDGNVCEIGTRLQVGESGAVGVKYKGPDKGSDGEIFPGTETFTWIDKGGNPFSGGPFVKKAEERDKTYDGRCWWGTP